MIVEIEKGVEILQKEGFTCARFAHHDNYVTIDILFEELEEGTFDKLKVFGWTCVDDYIGYPLNYSEAFLKWYANSHWPERITDYGVDEYVLKEMAYEAWQRGKA